MASGRIGDCTDGLNSRVRVPWTETSKVYTRRIRKKSPNVVNYDDIAATISSFARTTSTPTLTEVSPAASVDHDNSAPSPWRTTYASPVATNAQLENGCRGGAQESVEALVGAGKAISSKLKVQESSACQTAELNNLENNPLPSSNVSHDLKTTSPHDSANKLLETNDDGAVHLREALTLSTENDLQNGRSVETPKLPVRNDSQYNGKLESTPSQIPIGSGHEYANAVAYPLLIFNADGKVRFHISNETPKNEIEELRKRLEWELDQVRRLVKELQAKEIQLSSYKPQISDIRNVSNYVGKDIGNVGGYINSQHQHSRKDLIDRRVLLRVNSEVGKMQFPEIRPMGLARVNSDLSTTRTLGLKPYGRQLSVAVMENNQRTGESVEKEKRTPKANQYYRKSEFLLAKDRLPPESNKRLKTNKAKRHRGETEYAFGFGFGFDKSRNQLFKSCSSILQRLMKHSHGWVFNEPVNAKALGLHDYHDVITHPMDLGTIKTRLSKKWYRSPREFAEDVRLVFRNAMTYNPKGQDVHFMAEQLSQIFEERWAVLENEYNPYWKYQMYLDAGLPTPTYRMAIPQSHYGPVSVPGSAPTHLLAPTNIPATVATPTPLYTPNAPHVRTLDRPELISGNMAVDPITQRPNTGRTPVPKKPKAKDPNKRDMTYDEKQRLSTNLQNLPTEKLDAIVQIIKRRNTALSQRDNEIEVDIDRVDTETLWELDRFVTNYKKSLSKIKRKAEMALQARMAASQNTTTEAAEVQIGNGSAFDKSAAPLAAEGEKHGYSGSRSSSSGSSSSDSGSSSSDSDSDSSSSDGSDEGNSPKT